MKQVIPLVPGQIEFVVSRGELNFQEVVDDFGNAEFICVVTYNIAKESSYLLDELRRCAEDSNVEIFTNVPKRFKRYTREWARNSARKQIQTYLQLLAPNVLDAATFFNFNSHAKIVMTENIAYVGSANFSDESADNWEAGVLIRSTHLVKQLREQVIPLFEKDSVPYVGATRLRSERLAHVELLERLVEKLDDIHCQVHTTVEQGHREVEVYAIYDSRLSGSTLDQLRETLEELTQRVDEIGREGRMPTVSALLNTSLVENIRDLTDEYTPIWNLGRFDQDKYAMEYLEEHCNVDEEGLATVAEDATQVAGERLWELAEEAEGDVARLLSGLRQLSACLESMIEEIIRLEAEQKDIDNT